MTLSLIEGNLFIDAVTTKLILVLHVVVKFSSHTIYVFQMKRLRALSASFCHILAVHAISNY